MYGNQDQTTCGIAKALEVLGGKWTLLIIRDLLDRPRRFGELESSLSGISPRTLAIRLKELEQDGVVLRDGSASQAHPVYRLTKRGEALQEIISQMRSWGKADQSFMAANMD